MTTAGHGSPCRRVPDSGAEGGLSWGVPYGAPWRDGPPDGACGTSREVCWRVPKSEAGVSGGGSLSGHSHGCHAC